MKRILMLVFVFWVTTCFADTIKQKINPSTGNLDIYGIFKTAPTSPTSPCLVGDVSFNGQYFFLCYPANTWKRTEIVDWVLPTYTVIYDGLPVNFEGLDVLY